MNDDRCTITIPHNSFVAIVDAVQRAVIDKGASRATRKASFSAILALVDAGLVIGAPGSLERDSHAPAEVRTRLRVMA